MIGQEVNSPAQKLLRSARRKRGALQGALGPLGGGLRLTKRFLSVVLRLKSSWRGWIGWLASHEAVEAH
jgi:hypothetical protein